MTMLTLRRLHMLLLFAAITSFSFAQDTTNMGTEFWVGYGHHQQMETGTNTQEMLIYFTTGSLPAVVTLSVDSSVQSSSQTTWWKRTYNIPANTMVSIDNFAATSYTAPAGAMGPIPKGGSTYDARLFTDNPPAGPGSAGLYRKKGIHIESNVPIAAYAQIYAAVSSGATMLLPLQAWGYTYRCINNTQVYESNCFSWAYVIAKEDHTRVEITPSTVTRNQVWTGLKPNVPKVIELQKGYIYQILGANDGSDTMGLGGTSISGKDLTGTLIRSISPGKPIAVFCGSSRTKAAPACGVGGGDNEIVQAFPLHVWGTRYLTAPTSGSNGVSAFSTNMYKIVVNDPTTVVKKNGAVLTSLVNNGYYHYESNTADYIEADKPVMLAQFMGGGSCNQGASGDADMYYLSPMDAGTKQANTVRTTVDGITINYLTLIVPSAGVSSLLIDGTPTFDHSYLHPQRAGYTVVVKKWNASRLKLTVQSDSAFTGITYGLGAAESYGFNIGTKFNPIHGLDPLYKVRWRGTINSDWNNENNWSTGLVPTEAEHVLLPAGTANSPVIPAGVEVTCKSLTVDPGAAMTVQPGGKVNVKQ
jgi:hypothetical protein